MGVCACTPFPVSYYWICDVVLSQLLPGLALVPHLCHTCHGVSARCELEMVTLSATLACRFPQDDASPSTADAVNTVLLCLPVPSYPLFRGLLYFTLERVLEEYVAATTFEALPDPYSKIQWYLVALVCQAAASVVILFFIQLVKTYW